MTTAMLRATGLTKRFRTADGRVVDVLRGVDVELVECRGVAFVSSLDWWSYAADGGGADGEAVLVPAADVLCSVVRFRAILLVVFVEERSAAR